MWICLFYIHTDMCALRKLAVHKLHVNYTVLPPTCARVSGHIAGVCGRNESIAAQGASMYFCRTLCHYFRSFFA